MRPISQPLTGPANPKTTRPAAAANETEAVDRPAPRSSSEERSGRRPHASRDQDDDRGNGDHDPAVEERATHHPMLARETLMPVGIQHMGF